MVAIHPIKEIRPSFFFLSFKNEVTRVKSDLILPIVKEWCVSWVVGYQFTVIERIVYLHQCME